MPLTKYFCEGLTSGIMKTAEHEIEKQQTLNEFKNRIEDQSTPPKKFFTEGLNAYLLKKAKEELGETEEVRTKSLNELIRLIKEEPDFYPYTDDYFLLRFLRARKFNVGLAFQLLQNFYKYKARNSGTLTDLTPSALKNLLELGISAPLDDRDENGAGIIVFRLGKYDLDRFSPYDVIAKNLICTEMGMRYEANQICGVTAIGDCSDLSLRTLTRFAQFSVVYKALSAIQDCLPCRVKAIHVVNEPFYFSLLVRIAWIFLSEKLKKRIHFHGSNLSNLHTHFSPEILPKELGGNQGSYSDLREKQAVTILSMEDHYKMLNKYGYRGKTLEKLRKN